MSSVVEGETYSFLGKIQFIDSKKEVIAEVDVSNEKGEWSTITLNDGEKVVGFYGQLDTEGHIFSLGISAQ